jgi:hypothetical protein
LFGYLISLLILFSNFGKLKFVADLNIKRSRT